MFFALGRREQCGVRWFASELAFGGLIRTTPSGLTMFNFYAIRGKAKKSRNVASACVVRCCMEPSAVLWCCMASSLGALFTKAGQQADVVCCEQSELKGSENSKVGGGLGGKRSAPACSQVWHSEIFRMFNRINRFQWGFSFVQRIKAVGALQMQLAGFSVGPNAWVRPSPADLQQTL